MDDSLEIAVQGSSQFSNSLDIEHKLDDIEQYQKDGKPIFSRGSFAQHRSKFRFTVFKRDGYTNRELIQFLTILDGTDTDRRKSELFEILTQTDDSDMQEALAPYQNKMAKLAEHYRNLPPPVKRKNPYANTDYPLLNFMGGYVLTDTLISAFGVNASKLSKLIEKSEEYSLDCERLHPKGPVAKISIRSIVPVLHEEGYRHSAQMIYEQYRPML